MKHGDIETLLPVDSPDGYYSYIAYISKFDLHTLVEKRDIDNKRIKCLLLLKENNNE